MELARAAAERCHHWMNGGQEDQKLPEINAFWWEHLALKPMHRRLREMNGLFQSWCQTPYGDFWLKAALRPDGIIRVKPGEPIPVFHVIALEGRPAFVAPQSRLRLGHRTVGGSDELRLGPLSDGELALQPKIMLDVVTDPQLLAAASRGETDLPSSKVTEPSTVLSVPAHLMLAPKHWPKRSFVLYQHIFGEGGSYPDDGYFYVGVTTRSWQARWSEHRRAIENGSPLLFHRKFRDELAAGRVTYIHHKVMGITHEIEELYASEEMLVEGHWEDGRRLNLIPGGKSGLRYLREHGMLGERVIPLPDDRDRIVADWLRQHPRKGLPAPWVSEKWKDNDWAVAQICGREGRLSVDQVRAIRALAETYSADEIAARIGALNVSQVERVIDGRTYTRII